MVNGASRFADTFNWKVNMDDIYPDNGNGGQATIKWWKVGEAEDFDIIKPDFLKLVSQLLNSRSNVKVDGKVTIKDVGNAISE